MPELGTYAEALSVLGDENRLRLCALLAERELCVSDLVKVTGLAQSRVSTHLSRMREAGVLRHRRSGTQTFYGLSRQRLTYPVRQLLDELSASADRTLAADRQRLACLDDEKRKGLPESALLELDRDYSPGRTWQSLALGQAALLRLGDVLDVGSGDGTAASVIAPHCRSLTCIDSDERAIASARERLARHPHVDTRVADMHALPFEDGHFDDVLVFHTLTYAEAPEAALEECARVTRPGGRVIVLCLDQHDPAEISPHFGLRHPGFSAPQLRKMLQATGLSVTQSDVVCREAKKPHLRVVLARAEKPDTPTKLTRPGKAQTRPTTPQTTTLQAASGRRTPRK